MCDIRYFKFNKGALLFLMALSVILNAFDMSETCHLMKTDLHEEHFAVSVATLIVDGFIMALTVVGVYAILYEHMHMLQVYLIASMLYCFVKMVIWIICGNYLDVIDLNVDHLFFQLAMVLSVLCLCMTVLLCMQIHDQEPTINLG